MTMMDFAGHYFGFLGYKHKSTKQEARKAEGEFSHQFASHKKLP